MKISFEAQKNQKKINKLIDSKFRKQNPDRLQLVLKLI